MTSPWDALTLPRAAVRDLFLRVLGLVFVVAFLSLHSQVTLLVGEKGLLPAGEWLDSVRMSGASFFRVPTIFWLVGAGDGVLRAMSLLGAVLSLGLVFLVLPRPCLLLLWALYLSFATIGQDFLSFQWDNLLLESAFFALFVAPGGVRPRRAPAPHPVAVFLMLFLVFRLHVESGTSKLLTGDPTWRDLSAMATYYETAPIPTRLAWWAHQLPRGFHEASSLSTFVVEIGLAPCVFLPWRRARLAVFVAMLGMQASIALTANYGFFNWLSAALLLFVLDDGHLDWIARRFRKPLAPRAPARRSDARTAGLAIVAFAAVPLSVVPFLGFLDRSGGLVRETLPIARVLWAYRSINAYHLFASMTIDRYEVVIEGSDDGGSTWKAYEFRYKPGDPMRPPPFVAPHQPRVDFQMWFLALRGRRPREPWFARLVEKIRDDPETVAPLFSVNPFPDAPPKEVRIRVEKYRFTDRATRRATGAWWR